MIDKFKKLSEYRDSILVLGIILYSTGYTVWSIYALTNDLGFLPGLDLQYFIAGIPLIITGLLFYWLITLGRDAIFKYRLKIGGNAKGIYKFLRILSYVLFFISGIGVFFVIIKELGPYYISLSMLVLTIAIIFTPNNTANADEEISTMTESRKHLLNIEFGVSRFLYYYVVGSLTLYFLAFYLFGIFPAIPQEMGGVKPRKAVLYMQKQLIHRQISFANKNDSVDPIIKSDTITVFYYNNDKFIIKNNNQQVFEIYSGNIDAVEWIN